MTESSTKIRCGMCRILYSIPQPPFKVQLSKMFSMQVSECVFVCVCVYVCTWVCACMRVSMCTCVYVCK